MAADPQYVKLAADQRVAQTALMALPFPAQSITIQNAMLERDAAHIDVVIQQLRTISYHKRHSDLERHLRVAE